jgi:CheY-like chemotaxis protein
MGNAMTGFDGGRATMGLPLPAAMDPCILVVDDSSEVRRVVARVLTDARYAVLEAGDGAVALQILERGGVDIDLVLTDIEMPRLDGIELGRRIADRKWQVPIIYMTGGPTDAIAPVEPLLRKPFSIDTLVGVVDRVVRGRRAGQPAVASRGTAVSVALPVDTTEPLLPAASGA